MDELKQFSKNVNYLKSNWKALMDKFFESHEGTFIDLVQSQLLVGEDGNKEKLLPYASGIYEDFKRSIGSISVPYADLKKDGGFYDGMFMDKFNEIDSTDWKTGALFEKYGDDILDPQADKLNTLIKEQMIPDLEAYVTKELTKGI